MQNKKGNNPFEIVPASSTSQISPSPARTSVKSIGSQHRLSQSANRAGRSVSFAGPTKAGAEAAEQAGDIKAIQDERVSWQKSHL